MSTKRLLKKSWHRLFQSARTFLGWREGLSVAVVVVVDPLRHPMADHRTADHHLPGVTTALHLQATVLHLDAAGKIVAVLVRIAARLTVYLVTEEATVVVLEAMRRIEQSLCAPSRVTDNQPGEDPSNEDPLSRPAAACGPLRQT